MKKVGKYLVLALLCGIGVLSAWQSNHITADSTTIRCTQGSAIVPQSSISYYPASIRTDQNLKNQDYTNISNVLNRVCKEITAIAGSVQPKLNSIKIVNGLTSYVYDTEYKPYGDRPDRYLNEFKNAYGFYSPSKKVFVADAKYTYHFDQIQPTLFHESLHAFQNDSGSLISEGITEEFTQHTLKQGYGDAYICPVNAISKIISKGDPATNGKTRQLLLQSTINNTVKATVNDLLLSDTGDEYTKIESYLTWDEAAITDAVCDELMAWLATTKSKNISSSSAPNTATQSPASSTPTSTNSSLYRIVFITSTSNCNTCTSMKTIYANLQKKYAGKQNISFINYDFETNQAILKQYVDKADLPTMILKKNDQEVMRYSGAQNETNLGARIDELLAGTIQPAFKNVTASKGADNKIIVSGILSSNQADTIETLYNNKTTKATLTPVGNEINFTATLEQPITVQLTQLLGLQVNADDPAAITVNAKKNSKVIASTSTTPGSNTNNETPSTVNSGSLGFGNLLNSLISLPKALPGADANDGFGQVQIRVANVINFLFALASALLVLGVIWNGLLYIFSYGNDEQISKSKKNLINLTIGLVFLLGSFTIVSLVRNLIENGKIGL